MQFIDSIGYYVVAILRMNLLERYGRVASKILTRVELGEIVFIIEEIQFVKL